MIISLSPGRINELLLRIKNMLYKKPTKLIEDGCTSAMSCCQKKSPPGIGREDLRFSIDDLQLNKPDCFSSCSIYITCNMVHTSRQ